MACWRIIHHLKVIGLDLRYQDFSGIPLPGGFAPIPLRARLQIVSAP